MRVEIDDYGQTVIVNGVRFSADLLDRLAPKDESWSTWMRLRRKPYDAEFLEVQTLPDPLNNLPVENFD